jgi:hypothetical protein
MVEDLKTQAIARAHNNGAKLDSIEIAEMELIPLQYVSNGAVRAIVKAVSWAVRFFHLSVNIYPVGGDS